MQGSVNGTAAGVEGDNGGSGAGVFGNNTGTSGGPGVLGLTETGDGVQGYSNASNHAGVLGLHNLGGPGPGVLGLADNLGESSAGVTGIFGDNGVAGFNNSPNAAVLGDNLGSGPGVYGISASGVGVQGSVNRSASGVEGDNAGSGDGVSGEASGAGAGVHAKHSGSGAALLVDGPAVFNGPVQLPSAVGMVTMAANTNAVTVSNAQVTPSSGVFITPQSNPGMVKMVNQHWVTTTAGSFTIHAQMKVPAPMTFVYLVVNP